VAGTNAGGDMGRSRGNFAARMPARSKAGPAAAPATGDTTGFGISCKMRRIPWRAEVGISLVERQWRAPPRPSIHMPPSERGRRRLSEATAEPSGPRRGRRRRTAASPLLHGAHARSGRFMMDGEQAFIEIFWYHVVFMACRFCCCWLSSVIYGMSPKDQTSDVQFAPLGNIGSGLDDAHIAPGNDEFPTLPSFGRATVIISYTSGQVGQFERLERLCRGDCP